ncbi:MAG TPA: hypothetical protein VFH31_10890, partial [Pyrinomonadaceae bacterium]|nr:hypothetical protein [Pyrinomonadaceae bacterium]
AVYPRCFVRRKPIDVFSSLEAFVYAVEFIKASGGKPPFLTCKFLYLERYNRFQNFYSFDVAGCLLPISPE